VALVACEPLGCCGVRVASELDGLAAGCVGVGRELDDINGVAPGDKAAQAVRTDKQTTPMAPKRSEFSFPLRLQAKGFIGKASIT